MSVETVGPTGPPVRPPSLSPSRANDFLSCPLLFRFRTVDRLPEPGSRDAARGTLVHLVLERLFDLPAAERTPRTAEEMVAPAWAELTEGYPDLLALFADADEREVERWLGSARTAVRRWFTLEDPRRLEPAEREVFVEAVLESGLTMRGVVDRIDVAPDGAVRIVDYKGLAVDTPLPTPTGWTTMASVRVGDQLVGADGRPTRVTAKSEVHQRPCYRLRFTDGTSVVCDNVHLWSVVSVHRGVQSRTTMSAQELEAHHADLSRRGTPRSLWIEAADALDLPDVELPIDPWLLGAWLGDGRTRGGELTVGLTDLDDMVTMIKERWTRHVSVSVEGAAAQVRLCKSRDACTFGHTEFRGPTPGHPTRRCAHEDDHARMHPVNTALTTDLTRAGLVGNKHIPASYLRAGTHQRIDLLRGLMDTDGWWNATRRRAGFTTTDDRFADDVVHLLRTLGIHPLHFSKPYRNPVRPDRTWHIIEFTVSDFNPFALPRKAVPAGEATSTLRRGLARRRLIASVDKVPSVPTQCVTVDAPDSLYLCGRGFVPTHNSGRAPGVGFEAKALFQLKFYAAVLRRTRGTVPAMLQLVYLGSGEVLRHVPDEDDLVATERKVDAVWRAIEHARETGDWRARRNVLCTWCPHQAICPAWGGTPPPLPSEQ